MEKGENINQSYELPPSLDVKKILDEDKRPKSEDWKYIQGGEPRIEWINKDLCYVIHDYENNRDPAGTGKKVPTPIPEVKNWGISEYSIGKRTVAFPRALLWAKHGKPCEQRSHREYDRVEVKAK